MKKSDLEKKDFLLKKLSDDYFKMVNLRSQSKRVIFSKIEDRIETNRNKLRESIINEIKFTQKDAEEEINRSRKTFALAKKYADFRMEHELIRNGKKIMEKRIPRGPLLAVTPFSSPLSSPAHKIALAMIAGTSVLFKPSHFAMHTGKMLFEIISSVTGGKYIYFLQENDNKILNTIVSDERIGIISLTGGYKTGKELIRAGGVKKYHMELNGGNSSILFAPEYSVYNDELAKKIVSAITVKNGQRCVSVKHIFIPVKYEGFITKIQSEMLSMKREVQRDVEVGKKMILGPLISSEYARSTESKVRKILQSESTKEYTPFIQLERKEDYIFPTMYAFHQINNIRIKNILGYDLPGPIVFVHFYKDNIEYNQILESFRNDYIRTGLQLSIYTKNIHRIRSMSRNIIWGGIIVNDIPSFRNEFMSFGGFGRSGLGKEGFFETVLAFTDPQVFVY